MFQTLEHGLQACPWLCVSLQPHLLPLLPFLIALASTERWGILLLVLFTASCSQLHAFSREPLVKRSSPPALDSLVWLHILKTFLRLSFIYLFGAILIAKLKDP